MVAGIASMRMCASAQRVRKCANTEKKERTVDDIIVLQRAATFFAAFFGLIAVTPVEARTSRTAVLILMAAACATAAR